MATKPPMTDAEAAAEMERLMDELCPNRAEERAAMGEGRPFPAVIATLKKLESIHGPVFLDEDFADDVEDGRLWLRQAFRADLWD
jgi:hypothetical protein